MILKVKLNFNFVDDVWNDVSDEAKDLISKLLCPANERLDAKQALNHPWIINNTKDQ